MDQKHIHLEAWAEWQGWVTVDVYPPQHLDHLAAHEATLTASGHTLRRMHY